MMLNVGIIGCGNIAGRYDEINKDENIYTHAGMYTAFPQFKISCASDNNEKRLHEFCSFWQIDRHYPNYQELLTNEECDIISLATPDETHDQILNDIIELSKPGIIFTEKPLALTSKAALDIYESCLRKNIKLIVDYVRRWDKTHNEIKMFIDSGQSGKIKKVIGYYVRGLRHNGCQLINLIQFFFGKIKSVQVIGESNKGSIENDHSMDVRFILENQIEVYMMALDKDGYDFSIYELDIFGQNARIKISNGGQRFELYVSEADPQFPNFKTLIMKPAWRSTYGNALKRAGQNILSIFSNNEFSCNSSAQEAIDDLYVIEAVIESANNNNDLTHVLRKL